MSFSRGLKRYDLPHLRNRDPHTPQEHYLTMHPILLIALALPSIILLILVFWGWRTANDRDRLERENTELRKHLNASRDTLAELAVWVVHSADHYSVPVANITLERARNLAKKGASSGEQTQAHRSPS